MDSASHELEELLAHGTWVRALARSLVRDAALADDLAQQAWVAALERPPARSLALRRWFATVLRNLARQEARGASRRTAREQFASAREPGPPADQLSTTLELSQQLAEAVRALEEPYRGTIFRRYYEGLPPRRIAELDGVPLKTVKTRLARGLEQLRERLDRRHHGDRSAWLAACVPLLRGSAVPLALGGIVMNVKLVCVAAGLVLVGAWAVLRNTGSELPVKPAPLENSNGLAAAPLEAPAPTPESPREDLRQSAAPANDVQSSFAPAVVAAPRQLPGRVLDAGGIGVADVRLFFVTPDQAHEARKPGTSFARFPTCATSGAGGHFMLEPPACYSVLMGERAGFLTLLAADVWSNAGQKELLVVVAPRIDIAGVVVDAKDAPIAGAEVRITGGERLRRELGRVSDTAVEIPWTTRCDEQGHFAFEAVPGVASVELLASHPRHALRVFPMPELSRSDLRLVLDARESTVVAGEVVEPGGKPVEDALVGMGQMVTRTDANGRFELEMKQEFLNNEPTLSTTLSAIKPGRLPARMQEPPTGWPGFVTLTIGGEPLTIRGRVLDAEGKALAGVEVRATNEHKLGIVPSKVGNTAWMRTLESLARSDDEFESLVRTDAEGSFELRGLLDEEYVLLAFEKRTLRMQTSEPVHAGRHDVELRFAPVAGLERVAGRVLTVHSAPLAGVSVFAGRRQGEANEQPLYSTPRTTDAEGRFDFGEIATEGLEFQLSGQELQTVVRWKPPEGMKLSELELTAARRCHLQVDLGDRKEFADEVVVLGERGEVLEQWIWSGNMASFGMSHPIRDGKSDVLTVPEIAAIVVLKKNHEEVERRPVQLKCGAMETIRF